MTRCTRFALAAGCSLTMLAVPSYEALAGPVTGACCLSELCLELTALTRAPFGRRFDAVGVDAAGAGRR